MIPEDNDFSATFSGGSSFLYHNLDPWDSIGGIGIFLAPYFNFQDIIAPPLSKIPSLNLKLSDHMTCCPLLLQSSTEPLFTFTFSLMFFDVRGFSSLALLPSQFLVISVPRSWSFNSWILSSLFIFQLH